MNPSTLIFVPTFNERGNVERMHRQLVALNLDADILFLDDSSPDGTGRILDDIARTDTRVSVIHRAGKLGIGSAHQEGVAKAYERGYEILITLDCDFAHSPSHIFKLLAELDGADLVVGSRFLQEGSLSGWSLYRRSLTNLGHFLTRNLLKVRQDATNAFRAYNLRTIPREIFSLVKSHGYSFFFESLFIFNCNGFTIKEVPSALAIRTHGESKLSLTEALRSAQRLLSLYWASLTRPQGFRLERPFTESTPKLLDPKG
jgi:dolichol-phosphate mannosyltransferase